MAFRYLEIGALVAVDPVQAVARIGVLYMEHECSLYKTARACGVARTTMLRWCLKLKAQGYGDPRHGIVNGKSQGPPEPVEPFIPA